MKVESRRPPKEARGFTKSQSPSPAIGAGRGIKLDFPKVPNHNLSSIKVYKGPYIPVGQSCWSRLASLHETMKLCQE
jgi:hypothetical protein